MALPISNAPKNFHWIYKIFQDFALRSRDLKGHFGFGGADDINAEVLEYPYLWIEPVRTRIITTDRNVKSGYSTIEVEIRAIVADKLRSDLLNTPETISDVNEILMTIVAELSQHPYYALNNVKLVEDVVIETEIERNDDIVNSAVATMVFQYPFKYTYCSDPVNDVDGFLSISDMFLTVTASFCELVHDCLDTIITDIYTTGATLDGNTAIFQRNDGLTYSLDLSGFSSGTPSLSEVLDEGNTSGPNDIIFDSSQGLLFNNNSRLREGTIDAGLGGNKGIAQICGVGYELKWEAGRLYVMNGNGNGIRQSLYNFGITPSVNDDITYGYVVGSIWGLDDLNYYICSDNSTGAAVWDLISGTISLSDLTDVLITSTPSNGDSLVYNSSINKWEPGITAVNYDRLFDYVGTYSYSGTAPQGSDLTASVWDITRIEYFGSGVGSISLGTQSVDWINRYTHTYV